MRPTQPTSPKTCKRGDPNNPAWRRTPRHVETCRNLICLHHCRSKSCPRRESQSGEKLSRVCTVHTAASKPQNCLKRWADCVQMPWKCLPCQRKEVREASCSPLHCYSNCASQDESIWKYLHNCVEHLWNGQSKSFHHRSKDLLMTLVVSSSGTAC